jgi:hypothetical protein
MANTVAPEAPDTASSVATKSALTQQNGRPNQNFVYPPIPPEEWQERGKRILAMLDEWIAEGPQEDLATWVELEAGLKANPVRFREVAVDG